MWSTKPTEKSVQLFGGDAIAARLRRQEEEDHKIKTSFDTDGLRQRDFKQPGSLTLQSPLFRQLFNMLERGDYCLILDFRTGDQKQRQLVLDRRRHGQTTQSEPDLSIPKVWLFHPGCQGATGKATRRDVLLFVREHAFVTVGLPEPPPQNPEGDKRQGQKHCHYDSLHNDYHRLAEANEWPAYITERFPTHMDCTCPLREYVLSPSSATHEAQHFQLTLPHPYFYLYDTRK